MEHIERHPAEEPTMTDLPDLPIEHLVVRPLADVVIDRLGHDPRSDYVERFWLGVLGPSAVWLLRRLVAGLDDRPEGYDVHLPSVAAELGLGARSGRNGPFMRTLGRCERFGLVVLVDDAELQVRRKLPPLTRFQLERLPAHRRAEHARWQAGLGPEPSEHGRREEARGLALSLLEQGRAPEATEAALHQ